MKKNIWNSTRLYLATLAVALGGALAACSNDDNGIDPEPLQREDIRVTEPEGGFAVEVDQLLRIAAETEAEDVSFLWTIDGEKVSTSQHLEYMFPAVGTYNLALTASKGEASHRYEFTVTVSFGNVHPIAPDEATAYITQVFDFMPAVGQFTNQLPAYVEGDTQADMNQKVLAAIGNNNRGMVSLGGFGGYVVVGFDHTIENREGLRDFRVLGNAFYSAANPSTGAPEGGSCEPGIIMVAYDKNGDGEPNADEWYEIAGSAHEAPTQELWYGMALKAGNDVNTYRNYSITYHRPEETMDDPLAAPIDEYIRWEDNRGHSGYKAKLQFHSQPYFPQWYEGDALTFTGTCLPQNGIDESGQGNYYVLYKFRYGYADNETNTKEEACIDIDWAVNSKGQNVHLPGVDFIKIYCGVNQENGWIGECSTEICGVEDLHILGEEVPTREQANRIQ